MASDLSKLGAEFLAHYQHDLKLRWSPKDLAAQQEFVRQQVLGIRWLDWSTETAALELLQAGILAPFPDGRGYQAVLLAGPIVELIPPAQVFALAAQHLDVGARLIAIIPCLRDNSPESQWFLELAAEQLWPYSTAEELHELLGESGYEIDLQKTRFHPINQFKEAVLRNRLAFKGFRPIFERIASEGYEPMEIGWGELHLVATPRLRQEPASPHSPLR